MMGTKRLRPPVQKTARFYRQLWRVVDGAIGMALAAHPEYLAPRGLLFDNARRSIAKRVTGAVIGYAEQSAQVRSGIRPAHERAGALDRCAGQGGDGCRPIVAGCLLRGGRPGLRVSEDHEGEVSGLALGCLGFAA